MGSAETARKLNDYSKKIRPAPNFLSSIYRALIKSGRTNKIPLLRHQYSGNDHDR
jgi:hypothetical protein